MNDHTREATLPLRFLIEVCVSTIEDAIVASQLGADRLELSAALETDGVTPSLGMLREVMNAVSIPVVTLIRVRSGNFVYDSREVAAMLRDAELAMEYGSQAIAVGCLTPDREIDVAAMRLFAATIGGKNCVCHRAFDQSVNLMVAAEELCELGYRRILTSGGAANAVDGAESLSELSQRFGHRIEVLVAGGVSPSNIAELATQTGCVQFHGSFRRRGGSDSVPRLDGEQLAAAIRIRNQQ